MKKFNNLKLKNNNLIKNMNKKLKKSKLNFKVILNFNNNSIN